MGIKEYISEWIKELSAKESELIARSDTLEGPQLRAVSEQLAETQLKILKLTELEADFPKVEDANTWWGYIRKLDSDEEFRKSESRKAEILRLSMKKAKERLYSLHTYMDGEVSPIILNYETSK